MGRIVIIFFTAFFFVVSAHAQENKVQHTLELNLLSLGTGTVDFHYTYHGQSKLGLRAEAGYGFERNAWFINFSERNLDKVTVTGYFLKAGPELGIYEGTLKRVSIALMPFYGAGRFNNFIEIDYPLGVFEAQEQYGYTIYGASLHFGVTVFQSNQWFSAVSMEQSGVIKNLEGNPVKPADFPGIGLLYTNRTLDASMAFRFKASIGYRF